MILSLQELDELTALNLGSDPALWETESPGFDENDYKYVDPNVFNLVDLGGSTIEERELAKAKLVTQIDRYNIALTKLPVME